MKESRMKNATRNIIYSIFLQLTKIGLVFIGRIIFVKELGAVYLGINGLFSNILSVLSIADLGMATAMMYSLYKPLAEDDKEKIAAYMNFFKKAYNCIALVVAILGIILIPFLKYIVNLPGDVDNIYLYYLLLLANTVISYLFVYKTTLLTADQKNYIITKYDIVFQVVLFALQMIVLLLVKSFGLYLFVNVLCTFVGNIFKIKATERVYPYINSNKSTISKEEKEEIIVNIKSLFSYKIGGVIQSNTDNILISIFVGTIVVGYYSNYNTIILYITTFMTLVFTSLKASLGNYIAEKDTESQVKLFYILETVNFWLVSLCSICFISLASDFVNICFGKEYVLSNIFLIGITLNFYTSNIRQTIWMYRETTGIFEKTKYVSIVTSIVNIFLSIIGGKYFGIVGIVYATVISRMVYAWWEEPNILFKTYFKSSSKKYFTDYFKRIILTGILVFVIDYIYKYMNISNIYIGFIVKGIIAVLVTCICFYIIYRKSEAFQFFKNKIIKARSKK